VSSRAAFTLTVLKLGGSVLTGRDAYRTAAAFLASRAASPDSRLLVVVSAELGHTDALLDEARAFAAEPDADALDLLWSTGEMRSVALITLALKAAGVAAVALNPHEAGLRAGEATFALNPIALRAALARHTVVVVAGFIATRCQRLVTLGRGGSDLSAVVLAAALGADRLELIKDVDGYFTADPHVHPNAQLIDRLHVDDAVQLADNGCPLVQRQAVAAARDARLPLVVRSLTSAGTSVTTS
jgi:aspartate kinase